MHKNNDRTGFRRESLRMLLQASMLSAGLATIMGASMPILTSLFERPEYLKQIHIMWLMLIGAWFRTMSDGMYYLLYARHQDVALGVSGIVTLVTALLSNSFFVFTFGLIGIGYSAVLIGLFSLLWNITITVMYQPTPRSDHATRQPF